MSRANLPRQPKRAGTGAPQLRPAKKARVAEDVTVQLVRLILAGTYARGSKLPPERELSALLAVTRTSLREALRRMESMGLIRVRAGDGIYVADHRADTNLEFVNFLISEGIGLDKEFLLSMEETRRIFALEMIGLAVERIEEEELAALGEIVDAYPEDPSELISGEWDFKFYFQIAKATKNRAFVHMLNTLKGLFGQLRWVYLSLDEKDEESAAELNRKVVKALRAGDKKRAVALVEKRMKRDRKHLSQLLDAVSGDTLPVMR